MLFRASHSCCSEIMLASRGGTRKSPECSSLRSVMVVHTKTSLGTSSKFNPDKSNEKVFVEASQTLHMYSNIIATPRFMTDGFGI